MDPEAAVGLVLERSPEGGACPPAPGVGGTRLQGGLAEQGTWGQGHQQVGRWQLGTGKEKNKSWQNNQLNIKNLASTHTYVVTST